MSFTIGFNKAFLKKKLKNDIKSIIDDIIKIKNYTFNEDIDYSNISLDFLKYINLFTQLANEGKKKEEINKLYLFLCNYTLNNKESFTIDLKNESLNYFNLIKDIIIEYSVEIKKENSKIEKQNETFIEKNEINKCKEEKIDISTKSNSSDELDKNKISPQKINAIPSEKKDKLVGQDFFLGIKFVEVYSLCQEINYLLNKFEIQEEHLNNYLEMKIKILNNQILITKLSNTISVLKNANNFNLKRRVVESLFFEIYSKYSNYFSFSTNYKPNNKILNILFELLQKALKICSSEDEKIKIENDIQKLNNFMNEKNIVEENSTIKINNFDENGKYLYVIMEFLRFCKSRLNPGVHASGKNIDFYLLPSSLFDSNFEYKNYIFTYDDLIDKKKKNEKNEKNKQNFEIYKINKTISLENALHILFSSDIKELEENFGNILSFKKKQLDDKIKTFKKYTNSFKRNSLYIFSEDYFDVDKENNPPEFLLVLSNYEEYMKKILNDEINPTIAIGKIEEIKKFICSEVNDTIKSIKKKQQENIEYTRLENLLTIKKNKICALYNFVKNLYDKFFNALNKIYEDYIKSLEYIIEKGNYYKKEIKSLSNDETDLFKLWISSSPRVDIIYAYEENLIDVFNKLCKEIRLNVNLTFDEKIILWCIKNGFGKYLENN